MRLFTLLSGYVLLMLGIILAIHFDFTIGVIVGASGLFMFWAMLPIHSDQNERLRRYERQHQQWLRNKQ
jgi:Zn-dependent membrane protease YugP